MVFDCSIHCTRTHILIGIVLNFNVGADPRHDVPWCGNGVPCQLLRWIPAFFYPMLVRPERERFMVSLPSNLLFSSVVLTFRSLTTLLQPAKPVSNSWGSWDACCEDAAGEVKPWLRGISRHLLLCRCSLIQLEDVWDALLLSAAGSYSSADIVLHVCGRWMVLWVLQTQKLDNNTPLQHIFGIRAQAC